MSGKNLKEGKLIKEDLKKEKIAQEKEREKANRYHNRCEKVIVSNLSTPSGDNINKELLEKIPPSLAKIIEIDETSDRARLQNLVRLLELYESLEINNPPLPNLINFLYIKL